MQTDGKYGKTFPRRCPAWMVVLKPQCPRAAHLADRLKAATIIRNVPDAVEI
jgi:hypothetical protein